MRRMIAILIFLSLFSIILPVAATENVQMPEVSESVEKLLLAIGVSLDMGEERPITRAESANLLCNVAGIKPIDKTNNTFSDTSGINAEGYINALSSMGYITGFSDGTFHPDDGITFPQLASIAVNILGFGTDAQMHGDYPSGYLSQAFSIGVFNGIDMQGERMVTVNEAILIAYNILNADYKKQTAFGERNKYVYGSGITLLSEAHKIVKYKGVVTAIPKTSVEHSDGCADDKIAVKVNGNNLTFDYKDKTENLIGRKVTAFVKEENGDTFTAVVVMLCNQEQQEFTIDLNIQAIEKSNRTGIEYYMDNKRADVKFDELASYIYNGVYDVDYSPASLVNIKNGTLTMIDNNSDGIYDVICVNEYHNYLVDAVDIQNELVYDKYGLEPLTIHQGMGKYLSITENGVQLPVESIAEWDVLSVYQSNDIKVTKIIVNKSKIIGEITQVNEEDLVRELIINNQTYKLAFGSYQTEILKELKVGAWGFFYLDANKNIAGADLKSTRSKYAIAVAAKRIEKLSNQLNVKLFTALGKYKIYKTKSKVMFNGNIVNAPEMLDSDELKNSSGAFKPQLITYKIDENDQINELNTSLSEQDSDDKHRLSYVAKDVSGRYRSTSNAFASKYMIGVGTPIFGIPASLENGNFEDKDLTVLLTNYFSDQAIYNNLSFYDRDDTNNVGAITYVIASTNSDLSKSVSFIKKVTSVINDDGECVNKIYYMQKGVELEGYTSSEYTGLIKPGQGIRFSTQPNGDIVETIALLHSSDEPLSLDSVVCGDANLGASADLVIAVGIVKNIAQNAITLENSDFIYRFNNTNFLTYYDKVTKEYFKKIISSYIRTGMKVFIVKNNDLVSDIVVLAE